MSVEPRLASERLAELRAAFDRTFSEAPAEPVALEDLLEVQIGAASYALRVREIAGVFADIPVTPVPSAITELRGIAGLRGAILPVYDLRALLGQAADGSPRWIAIAGAASVGLAFDGFLGQIRVPRAGIAPRAGATVATRHVADVIQLDGRTRPIVSVASVLDAITSRVREVAPEKE